MSNRSLLIDSNDESGSWLTTRDVATLLSISPRALHRLIDSGQLEARRVDHQIKIHVSDVYRYLQDNEIESVSLISYSEECHPLSDRYSDHMTRSMTATDLKATLLSVLDEVASGEEVEITKRGKTVARLVPAAGSNALRGSMTGIALSTSDEEDLFSTGSTWDVA